MSMTGLEVFDKTVHTTNNWLKDLLFELNWEDRHRSYLALRACLQSLRDRLTVEEAADLGAQLPMLIRGIYYEGWKPSATPDKIKSKEAFLKKIRGYFPDGLDADPENIARAVFKMLYHRISEGEILDIKQLMPPELEELWPQKV